MRRLLNRPFFLVFIFMFCMGNLWAAQSPKLPNGFKPLVPQGYELSSPLLVKSGHTATLSFNAQKKFEGRHAVFFSDYHLELFIKEATDDAIKKLIKMQAPMYRTQHEKDIESVIQSRSQNVSDPITGYDPAELTKYSWGAAITQRIIHKYMGAGKAPDEIEYSCVYLGFISDDRTIKKFKLTVSGVETRPEADQWANKAAETIEKTNLNNFDK